MPQGLLKHFEVLKKYRNKFGCLVHVWNGFYNSFKAKSQSAIRLHWCKTISIIFAPSYGDSLCQNHFKDVCAHCYCASLVRSLYMTWQVPCHVFQARAPSRNSTKYTADDLCSNLICKYFCWMLGDPHFFFGSSLPFLILSIILKNKKNLYVGSFNYFSYTIQIGSNWYMDTGVRDLEVACFKANSTWINDIGSKDLSNRPIYAVLNTHNLDMILQLKYMPIVMNPARIASSDWKS